MLVIRRFHIVGVIIVGAVGIAAGVLWIQHYINAEADRRAQAIISERQRQVEELPVCEEPPTLEEEIAEARRRLEAFGNTNITPALLRLEVTRMRMERPIFPAPCHPPNTPVR